MVRKVITYGPLINNCMFWIGNYRTLAMVSITHNAFSPKKFFIENMSVISLELDLGKNVYLKKWLEIKKTIFGFFSSFGFFFNFLGSLMFARIFFYYFFILVVEWPRHRFCAFRYRIMLLIWHPDLVFGEIYHASQDRTSSSCEIFCSVSLRSRL